MKKCFKCEKLKELNEFYRHTRMGDGRLNKCKECAKKDTRKNRVANIEHYRAYDRARGNRQDQQYVTDYRAKFPKKYKAHSMVSNAVRSGKIVKPSECSECCQPGHIEAHHDDYEKPLEVRWLCAACHKQWHAKHGEAKNAA